MLLSFFKNLKLPPRTEETHFKAQSHVTKSLIATMVVINMIEFIFYAIIFIEMYIHHKRHVNLCLENKPKIANKLKRKNTITTIGHFTSWAAELLIFGGLAKFISANEDKFPCLNWIFIMVSMQSINYVIFPSLQAFASPDLREHIMNFEWCGETSLCGSDNHQVEQGEEIELHTIPNGNAHPVP